MEGHNKQPMAVWKVAVNAPYGTNFVSVAARPADTPLVDPTRPPKIIAVCGLSIPNFFARKGVEIVTKMDLITPTAILIAITALLAPTAAPVTGPTIKVQAPAPMVVMDFAS